jgi:Zn-dependent protease
MDTNQIADIGIQYITLVVLLTFHEFGHAWTAMKCGDDTAKLQGRVSLNPLVHIDPIGTVVLPLAMMILPGGVSRFMIGWAKPVPVNPTNLRNKDWDDIWVTLAGPGMNLALAVILVMALKVMELAHCETGLDYVYMAAYLSLLLCFFNLIPIPPLDGSHLLRKFTGMTHETYARIAQYGFLLVIIVLQIPGVQLALRFICDFVLNLLCHIFNA